MSFSFLWDGYRLYFWMAAGYVESSDKLIDWIVRLFTWLATGLSLLNEYYEVEASEQVNPVDRLN